MGRHRAPELEDSGTDDDNPPEDNPPEDTRPDLDAPTRPVGRPRLTTEERTARKKDRETRRLKSKQDRQAALANRAKQPGQGPPDFSEWEEFFGAFIIRWITRAIVAFVFRGLSDYRSLITPEELEALELDPEDAAAIARPLAHVAERSAIGKKYGRSIIESRDAIQSLIALTMWTNRINRIAKKYRPDDKKKRHTHARHSGADVPEQQPEEGTPPPVGYAGIGQYRANGVGS